MVKEASRHTALKTALWSVGLNTVFAVVKAFAGISGHSFALVADAIESSTDILASLLVYAGLRYATRPADSNHPYGHGKAEPLITFLVVGFLVASALFIAHQSWTNIQQPHEMPKAFTLPVLLVIIVVKEAAYRMVHRRSRQTGSSSLLADAWHHRSDAITSLLAFTGISLALLLGPGYEEADDWAALAASGFIMFNAYLIFRPALGEIMDEHQYDELLNNIRKTAAQVTGVKGTEKCYIRKTGMSFHVDLHMQVDAQITVEEGHAIAHKLKDTLMRQFPDIADILIHVEPFPQ
ncbi:MAG: cation transporter [Chitinophagales bacterium]|nr:cation transporter [Chitinophagales bacterium]MCB9021883.1 cation transporter [Chitinophagales bacterium]MCB9030866.1 cation transporter [Chitinophagales bacterium]HPR28110.1 cation diffusion facilitator family transporter [Chitinophagales bacterium]HRX22806.1 cation diffusion facilitator family transporter [Chitinophagales bacterium]